MASEVDICNLALSYLGDTAAVASIDPPDQSAQAQHCARFYPIARDSLLEMHTWGFATRRAALAAYAVSEATEWDYAYACPSDAINIIAVLPPDATDDYTPGSAGSANLSQGMAYSAPSYSAQIATTGPYAPQPFETETNAEGLDVIYSDQANAVLRYTAVVTDSSRFSPTFTIALGWHLAALMAGTIIKGSEGSAQAERCEKMVQAYLSKARDSDTDQRVVRLTHTPKWILGR